MIETLPQKPELLSQRTPAPAQKKADPLRADTKAINTVKTALLAAASLVAAYAINIILVENFVPRALVPFSSANHYTIINLWSLPSTCFAQFERLIRSVADFVECQTITPNNVQEKMDRMMDRAIWGGNLDSLERFVKAFPEEISQTLRGKISAKALHRAIRFHQLVDPKVLDILKELNLDVNSKIGEGSFLHLSIMYRCPPAIIKALVSAGANQSITNNNGATPLHLAAWFQRFKAAEVLLQSGGNPNMRADRGITALDLACFWAIERWGSYS